MNQALFTKKKNKSTWIIFTLLFVIFFLPLILAWTMFYDAKKIHFNTVNYGELIKPPRQLAQWHLLDLNHQAIDFSTLEGKWLMLYLLPKACDQACQANLFTMRQIQIATGKDSDRIQRVIVSFTSSKSDSQLTQLLQTDYRGTQHLMIKNSDFANAMAGLDMTPLAMQKGYLYLVDPLGNIMMAYPSDANRNKIFKDVQRLLKVSGIG